MRDLRDMVIGETTEVTADGKFVNKVKKCTEDISKCAQMLAELFATHDNIQAKKEYGIDLRDLKKQAVDVVELLEKNHIR